MEQLTAAAAEMRKALATIDGVFDITDSFQDGKQQLELTLRDDAQRLGITTRALAAQVRGAFFGVEAQRIQDGRDDVRGDGALSRSPATLSCRPREHAYSDARWKVGAT